MKILSLIFCLFILPYSASAQDAFYLSGLLGLSQFEVSDSSLTTSPDFDAELAYGLRAGLLFNDHVSAGVFIQQTSAESRISVLGIPVNADYSLRNIMAEVSYYFNAADENTFWVSGLLGVMQVDVDSTLNSNDSETALGATVGYQFAVAPNFSLSPQFTIIYADSTDGSVTQMSGLINLTAWL